MAEDHYAVLGIQSDASKDEILHAYSELAKKCHPDWNRDDPNAEEKFLRIQRSFEMLYEPERHEVKASFHTPMSAFLTNHCRRRGEQKNVGDGGLALPLIGMATVFYLVLLVALFLMRPSQMPQGISVSSVSYETSVLGNVGVTPIVAGLTLVYAVVAVTVLYMKPPQ